MTVGLGATATTRLLQLVSGLKNSCEKGVVLVRQRKKAIQAAKKSISIPSLRFTSHVFSPPISGRLLERAEQG